MLKMSEVGELLWPECLRMHCLSELFCFRLRKWFRSSQTELELDHLRRSFSFVFWAVLTRKWKSEVLKALLKSIRKRKKLMNVWKWIRCSPVLTLWCFMTTLEITLIKVNPRNHCLDCIDYLLSSVWPVWYIVSLLQSLRCTQAGCWPGVRDRLRATEELMSPTSHHPGETAWPSVLSFTTIGPSWCNDTLMTCWPVTMLRVILVQPI